MKKILFSLLLLVPLFSYAQGVTIIGTADNGKMDTVTFGFKSTATIGIDRALGEANIFGQPTKEVDMRVVQRDSLNFSCSYTFSSGFRLDTFRHFYPVTFDSKSNFRSRSDTSFTNRLFEVKFFSKNIKKISIYSWQEPNFPNLSAWEGPSFYLDTCLAEVTHNIALVNWGPSSSDPIRLQGLTYFAHLFITFKTGALTSVNNDKKDLNIRLFPNPVSDRLTIDNLGISQIQEVRLFDVLGRQVLSEKTGFKEKIDIDVLSLQQGTYFASLFDKENRLVLSKMFVKIAPR